MYNDQHNYHKPDTSTCTMTSKATISQIIQPTNTHTGESEVQPYLLVNIGSGVSLIKVDASGHYERVSGSSLGGGTFWGLARLLTRAKDFDELLQLCAQGDNSRVDMLVGDIYGGRDYTAIGLSANTIASSFGKVIGGSKELEDYEPADLALSALRMISYNIGQLAYLNAKMHGLTCILFGGFYIRAHPYIMETISFAIRFWSKVVWWWWLCGGGGCVVAVVVWWWWLCAGGGCVLVVGRVVVVSSSTRARRYAHQLIRLTHAGGDGSIVFTARRFYGCNGCIPQGAPFHAQHTQCIQ